jgi:hypothetical protein
MLLEAMVVLSWSIPQPTVIKISMHITSLLPSINLPHIRMQPGSLWFPSLLRMAFLDASAEGT